MYRNPFQLIYEAPKGYLSLIRDQRQTCLNEIVTDQRDIYDVVLAYLKDNQDEEKILQLFERDGIRLDQIYRISHELEQALSEKVWLKSGGYLVIQPTEAMTVIDVNTGKAIKGKRVEEHFLKINLEAAREIGRQLRLRNLSGIIVVDFIDIHIYCFVCYTTNNRFVCCFGIAFHYAKSLVAKENRCNNSMYHAFLFCPAADTNIQDNGGT